jgi:hypothetical protein
MRVDEKLRNESPPLDADFVTIDRIVSDPD